MLKPNIPPQQRNHASATLKQMLDTIIHIGQATQQDYVSNSHYANLIFDIGKIIQELDSANRN
tara:strand:- start:14 stop:202 length:189 start_codon:yes stop_codon:yes gene_type:complete